MYHAGKVKQLVCTVGVADPQNKKKTKQNKTKQKQKQKRRSKKKKKNTVESGLNAKEIEMGTTAESFELRFRLYLYLNDLKRS